MSPLERLRRMRLGRIGAAVGIIAAVAGLAGIASAAAFRVDGLLSAGLIVLSGCVIIVGIGAVTREALQRFESAEDGRTANQRSFDWHLCGASFAMCGITTS